MSDWLRGLQHAESLIEAGAINEIIHQDFEAFDFAEPYGVMPTKFDHGVRDYIRHYKAKRQESEL